MIRVCIVCSGNICRSPTAEGTLRHLVERAGLAGQIDVESRGTGEWHVGEPPDARTVKTARAHGIALTSRACVLTTSDLERFDWILPVDGDNLRIVQRLAKTTGKPALADKIRLLRSFEAGAPANADVPDPYYGGREGFEDVFAICMRASEGLLAFLRAHQLK